MSILTSARTEQGRRRARLDRHADRNVERPLSPAELFFSTTNSKGVITSGNRTFARVSGYPIAEMIGKAHNIVRHPDMPRAVFRVLWDTIQEGRPVCAYVKNRTADGAYYWVMASVMPIDSGYLSVRLAPGSEHFALAKELYSELRSVELQIEGDDLAKRKDAILASVDLLSERLAEAGYPSYHAFMREALPAEVSHRDDVLPAGHTRLLSERPGNAHRTILDILDTVEQLSDFLRSLVVDLARYTELGNQLSSQASYLRTMGDDVRLFALNAQVGASRLGREGAALDAVARLLTEQSNATSPMVSSVAEYAANAVGAIKDMIFQVGLSNAQTEMLREFAHECAAEQDDELHETAHKMLALTDGLQRGSAHMFEALNAVAAQLSEVVRHISGVALATDRLSRLAFNGRIETASVADSGQISRLFDDVDRQVREASDRLRAFGAVSNAAADLKEAARHQAMYAAAHLNETAAALAHA